MSVILTDMEMPSGCWYCEFSEIWDNGSSLCKRKPMESPVGNYEKRPAWCPLKEQEARILDWDEIKNYSVVYGEFKGFKDIYPLIISLDDKGRPLSWSPYINTSEAFLLLVDDEEDRKNTRCWNKEPTEEQRQAVKWE